MIPEAKHLSQQQSSEAKLHRKELQGGSGQQEVMKERGIYEINNGNKVLPIGISWELQERERERGDGRVWYRSEW